MEICWRQLLTYCDNSADNSDSTVSLMTDLRGGVWLQTEEKDAPPPPKLSRPNLQSTQPTLQRVEKNISLRINAAGVIFSPDDNVSWWNL